MQWWWRVVAGIALALSVASPGTHAVSVEPENFDGMRLSLSAGKRVSAAGGALSMADALMAPMPGVVPFALAQQLMEPGLAVSVMMSLATAVAYAPERLETDCRARRKCWSCRAARRQIRRAWKSRSCRSHRRKLRFRNSGCPASLAQNIERPDNLAHRAAFSPTA